MISRALPFVLMLTLVSCGQKNTPEGVADAFLFRYFIELNQRGALELSTGLAEQKLQKEIELTQSVRMEPNLDLSSHRPFIGYDLVTTKERGDGTVTLYYDVTIEQKGGSKTKREMVLSTTQVDGEWRVTNFDVFDRRLEP